MERRFVRRGAIALAAAFVAAAIVGTAGAATDLGQVIQVKLLQRSEEQFGVSRPLAASSSDALDEATASADPLALATLAEGLSARVVTSGVAGPNIDMMALWPTDTSPTHIIACNEQGADEPGLQRIELATGGVETILTGTISCDPTHRTPWGTIVFGEENGGGSEGGMLIELIDPLNTTGVTLDRTAGTFSGGTGASNFAIRSAFGRNSYEGVAIYPNGITYFGDENRPGAGTGGGAYFKFVPQTLRTGTGTITSLAASPLAEGSVYGLRLGLRGDEGTDYGQGTQLGLGKWVELSPISGDDPDLRALAAENKLTGYYRPEDLAIDQGALAAGQVHFCGNNTGNEDEDQWYGETICITDGTLAAAGANTATPEVQRLVEGNPQYAMPDNIAYQPGRGNWIVMEDAETDFPGPQPDNNDMWSCTPDGADPDLLSDGCLRIATLNDPTAEWTGGFFDATGEHFYVSIQHNITGHGVVLEITGWK